MKTEVYRIRGQVIVLALDDSLKNQGRAYRSRKALASDPCPCGHARELHMQDGGCRGSSCSCDVPAAIILPLAA